MTMSAPSGVFCKADAGTTMASGGFATMISCTLVPGRNRRPGLSASTQISTVVLLGSSAGLTSDTLPASEHFRAR